MEKIFCTECGIEIDPETMWIIYIKGKSYCGDCGECLDNPQDVNEL